MESATEMLFSKANQNAELAKESSNEVPKEISESSENDKIQKESTDNITSIESGINSISLNPQEEQNKNPDKIEKNISQELSNKEIMFMRLQQKESEVEFLQIQLDALIKGTNIKRTPKKLKKIKKKI